jgi:hypothetical protein
MAHCGYEATAVEDTLSNPIKALLSTLRGPKTDGEMVAQAAPVAQQKSPLEEISVKVES